MATIRLATLTDLDAISQLNLDLFKFETQFGDTYSLDWTYSSTGQDYFKFRLTNSHGIVFVAEFDSQIIGYICGYEYQFYARKHSHMAEIDNMFIIKKYRNHTFGTQLVQAFETEAKKRGVKTIKVGALATNTLAHNFYKLTGFHQHEIIFEKKL